MNNKLIKKTIILIPFFELFSAYSFFSIGDFSVTTSFLAIAFLFIVGSFSFLNSPQKISFISLSAFLLGIIGLLISCFISPTFNFYSAFLFLFYFLIYFSLMNFNFSYSAKEKIAFFKKYSFVISLLALFGIVQFIGQFFGLGFLEVIIPNHMRNGFNNSNLVYFSSFSFYRSHSIFLEPSFLSQYSAIAIIILLFLFKEKQIKKAIFALQISINFIAMIISFAGTGMVVLAIFAIFSFIQKLKSYKSLNLFSIFVILIFIAFLLFLLINPFFHQLFFSRIFEFSRPGTSAHVRFVVPLTNSLSTLFVQPFGYGPGNTILSMQRVYPNYPLIINDMNSSYAKVIVELGWLGFSSMSIYLYALKKKISNKVSLSAFILLLTFQFLGGLFLDTFNITLIILFLLTIQNRKFIS